MKDRVRKKLEEIAGVLYKYIQNQKGKLNEMPLGLYSGEFGILLFLFYYSKYTNNSEYYNITEYYAEQLLSKLPNIGTHTFCSGLAGIMYLFDFLRKNDFIDFDIAEVESDFEDFLTYKLEQDIATNNYDFLHGALGVGLYFVNKRKDNSIVRILDFLYDTKKHDQNSNGVKWLSIIDRNENLIDYNISLSHGMSSIVLFLSRTIKQGIKFDKTYELLEKTINYILAQKIDSLKYGSTFPNFSKESIKPIKGSRLAWCYGDLGIGYSIWYAGRIASNKSWETKGLEILISSCSRKEGGVIDTGICHGSIGLVMIYRHLYLITMNKLFEASYKYWLNKTIEMATFKDGLAGYKTFHVGKWVPDYSLLGGITGVGLMFISYLCQDSQQWDEIFFL